MDFVVLRNITDDQLHVPAAGRTVPADGLLTVPADLYRRYAWSPATWRVEKTPDERKADQ